MAARCTSPLVEPPIACSTTMALRTEAAVMRAAGAGPPALAIATAAVPDASPQRSRSAWGAGMAAARGSDRPMASIMQAMVEAVPITMQVPTEGASRPLIASTSASSILPARCCPQRRRQSVQAPSTSPRWWPTTMGPTGTTMAGMPAEAAPMSCAGSVLSQPPTSTTASMGWARSISSVSIAMRLRRYMEVGWAKDSWMEMVGKRIGRPPASITPRPMAAMSCGALPWQGL